jgi:hypothetical protein
MFNKLKMILKNICSIPIELLYLALGVSLCLAVPLNMLKTGLVLAIIIMILVFINEKQY